MAESCWWRTYKPGEVGARCGEPTTPYTELGGKEYPALFCTVHGKLAVEMDKLDHLTDSVEYWTEESYD